MFHSLYARLFAYSFNYVKDRYAAEEIVEDAMLVLWEKRKNFNQIKNIKAYLYATVRNASFTWLKKKKKTIPLETELHDSHVNFDPNIIEEEVHAVLINALDDLPEKCRRVFELSCLEGLKYKDIAEDMAISVNTVKSQRARAITLLKKQLKGDPALFLFLNSL